MSTISDGCHAMQTSGCTCQTCNKNLICPQCTEMNNKTKQLKHFAYSLATPVATIAVFLALVSGPYYFKNVHTCTFVCISPKDCFATGIGLKEAMVGERVKAVLHTVDHRGNAYTGEIEIVTCEVTHESTGEGSDCEVKKTRGNEFEISYQTTGQGRHQLHIKVEGEHIKGSPFPVTVKPKPKTAPKPPPKPKTKSAPKPPHSKTNTQKRRRWGVTR